MHILHSIIINIIKEFAACGDTAIRLTVVLLVGITNEQQLRSVTLSKADTHRTRLDFYQQVNTCRAYHSC